jgi:multidrug resistance efflux pump
LALHRRVSPTIFKDLELQVAGIDKNLDQLQSKLRELRLLAQQNMATTESVEQVNREIQFYTRQRNLLQDRMAQEKAYAQEDLNVLRHFLGQGVNPGQVPKEVPLVAPISGHAVWVNPDVRQGSELAAGTPVAWLADMDPMRVRAQVHEIEAMQLRLGEAAEMTLESVPGRKFQAKVVSIPWTTSSPAPDQPSYFEVELEVPNPDFVLREGLKGMITFPAQR